MGQSPGHPGVRRLIEFSDRAAAGRLLQEVEWDVYATRDVTGIAKLSTPVARALQEVPRRNFVDESQQAFAYLNAPLPIGEGQTISQPYIVALMTELLAPVRESCILEVGTGSGYQAAVLSRVVREVFTVEIIAALAREAEVRWKDLGYENIHGCTGNGALGWEEHAPYDGIVVTAAAPEIPPALVRQLRPGGRLVIPVGESLSGQELVLVTKDTQGNVHGRNVLPVTFVPLVHSMN